MLKKMIWMLVLAVSSIASYGAPLEAPNLALRGTMHSWEPGAVAIQGHEPDKANDASQRSYWHAGASHLPEDLGVEWKTPQTVSSLIVRYFDGRMVRGPWAARTQQWARLQYWDGATWRHINAQVLGQETAVVRYVFPPVSTTRIRLVFTEPPDPQVRHVPDRTGIYICEFETYRVAPFQWVDCPGCLQKTDRPAPQYNEQPVSDSPVDIAGPLIIEPKQTRVFSDVLRPNLIVARSRWATQPAIASLTGKEGATLSNGFIQLTLNTTNGLKETHLLNRVTNESVDLPNSVPFAITNQEWKSVLPATLRVSKIDKSGSTQETARLRIDLISKNVTIIVHYELRQQDHFYHKWLTVENSGAADLQVDNVTVSSLDLPNQEDLMAGNELTYPVSRLKKGGFFECLQTVYWDHDGDALTYYPGATIHPGTRYNTEKAAVGVYKAADDYVAGWDRGVREWVIEYHAQVSPIPAGWPDIYLEGWSAKVGVTEMRKDPKWTEHFMDAASQLGVRYMDTREDAFRVLHYPPEWREQWVKLATKYNIGTGFWIDFGDTGGDTVNGLNGSGEPIQPIPCKLSPRGEDYYRQVLEMVGNLQLRALHWADFYAAWPCDANAYGHLPGKYSIYAQGQRMIKFADDMHAASPGIMLGADGGLTSPQYGRYADDRQHGGGEDAAPAMEPDIHLDRLYADMNRAYLNAAHMTYLRPWYRLLNCVNHFGQVTHDHDKAGFRYALLSAYGLTGQLTFDDAPQNIPASEIAFAQKWEDWVRGHKEYFQHSDRLFDRSVGWYDIPLGDAEGLQGFAHIRGNRGYIFLSNPGPVAQIAELTVALDPTGTVGFAVNRIFPGDTYLKGPEKGLYRKGDVIRTVVPGKQVQILSIKPAGVEPSGASRESDDADIPNTGGYIGHWSAERIPGTTTAKLHATFQYPSSGQSYLHANIPQSKWGVEPWAYNKAYLVIYVRSEKKELNDYWVPENLPVTISIDGVPKTAFPFMTARGQEKGLTRCFFVSLDGEVKPGTDNRVDIKLPILQGLVFSGAYIDLPDQMPGEGPGAD